MELVQSPRCRGVQISYLQIAEPPASAAVPERSRLDSMPQRSTTGDEVGKCLLVHPGEPLTTTRPTGAESSTWIVEPSHALASPSAGQGLSTSRPRRHNPLVITREPTPLARRPRLRAPPDVLALIDVRINYGGDIATNW